MPLMTPKRLVSMICRIEKRCKRSERFNGPTRRGYFVEVGSIFPCTFGSDRCVQHEKINAVEFRFHLCLQILPLLEFTNVYGVSFDFGLIAEGIFRLD